MPDKPSAELEIDEELVRALVVGQASTIADAATLPLSHAADGWDCSVWRFGQALAVRLPRRSLAAPLVLHEQQVLTDMRRDSRRPGSAFPRRFSTGTRASGFHGHGRSFRGSTDRPVSASRGATARVGPRRSPRRCVRCTSPLPRAFR
jgi:hypothetical protein